MNLSELRDIVRSEANIPGDIQYQNLLDFIINQELRRFTGKGKYKDLQTTAEFVMVDEQNSVDVPEDFQLFEAILYQRSAQTTSCTLGKGSAVGFLQGKSGLPEFYSKNGEAFNFYPSTSVVAGDTIILVYYKLPNLLNDEDELPVVSLETALIEASISRILRMSDSDKAMLARQEANQAFRDSRADEGSS